MKKWEENIDKKDDQCINSRMLDSLGLSASWSVITYMHKTTNKFSRFYAKTTFITQNLVFKITLSNNSLMERRTISNFFPFQHIILNSFHILNNILSNFPFLQLLPIDFASFLTKTIMCDLRDYDLLM